MDSLLLSTSSHPICHLTPNCSFLSKQTPKRVLLFPPSKPLKCSVTSFYQPHITMAHNPKTPSPVSLHFSASSPETPVTAMHGADGDAMGLLLQERIVFLGSDIDDFVADAIVGQLLLLDAQDPTKDIRLFINCPGGSLSATMAIFDVVRLVRADVSTIAIGVAGSTASLILGGGTKGKRFAMPNARIMIHQPIGGGSGSVAELEVQAQELKHNKENVMKIISEFTGRSYEQVEKDIDRDNYMSPMEALEYGIIDGIIDRDRIIPAMPVPEGVVSTLIRESKKDSYLDPEIPEDEIY